MIDIIGGFYEELCLYPQWNQFFGSGGRASTALSKLDKIVFHTYAHRDTQFNLDYFSKIYDIEIDVQSSTENIKFEYYNSLSNPRIHTLNSPLVQQNQITLKAETVICYGMLEAPNPIIHADYVIFDPQSENDPSMIFNNGSIIKHLAVVLNVEEGQRYTGKIMVEDIAEYFFKQSNVLEILILKDGPFGAHVFYDNEHYHIGSYSTSHVFKIGSGDVFVSIFGYMWAKEKLPPLEAAKQASLATAHYCNSKVLPIDNNIFTNSLPIFSPIIVNKEIFNKTIYLAGPFFTMAERWLIEEAKYQLQKFGAKVFSPLHDVGYGEPNFVTQADLKGIDEADILYAVLDDYDPGTIFEIGYAIAKQKPVVIFIENKVVINMTLFEGSGCVIEHDFATSIYKTIWEVAKTL